MVIAALFRLEASITIRAWTMKNLASGTYYWSVQAIDNHLVALCLVRKERSPMLHHLFSR